MKIEELVLGRKYNISFTKEQYPGHEDYQYYEGVGEFVGIDTYGDEEDADTTLWFKLPDSIEADKCGFDIWNVVSEVKDQPKEEYEFPDDIWIWIGYDNPFIGTRKEFQETFNMFPSNDNIVNYCIQNNVELKITPKEPK